MASMIKHLIAYQGAKVVGTLNRVDANDYLFMYAMSWLESKSPLPLSIQLPLQEEPFSAESTRVFFANLLPEGQVREFYAGKYRISADDDFGLLAKLAGDCAGAIALYPEGQQPPGDQATQVYRPLTEQELKKIYQQPYIMELAFLDEEEEGVRLSLAGAQDKLPIAFDKDNQISLPENGAPSTHILKPQHIRLNSLAENEHFCMSLAREMGLKVPETTLLTLAGEINYVVTRYDRVRMDSGKVIRIHQEDFCQATGTSYRNKYEENGGPGHKACFEILKKCKRPLADRVQLVKLTVFNYLICNADCHAKNLSLLYDQGAHPSLAPFYDLVCTAVYPNIKRPLAMSIGGDSDPDRGIELTSWQAFSKETGDASPKPTLKTLEEMAKDISQKAEAVARKIARCYGPNPIYAEIISNIRQRADKALRLLSQSQ